MAQLVDSIKGIALDLGYIRSESLPKTTDLFNTPLPASDSDELVALDIFGTVRRITISGTITGDMTNLQTFLTNMDSLQDGKQNLMTYTSSIHPTTLNVYITNFNPTYSEAQPTILNYQLELLEAGE